MAFDGQKYKVNMEWTTINFGKHSGKTMPQILFSDPDWFFWSVESEIWNKRGVRLKNEASLLNERARNIKIPDNEDGRLIVEYKLFYKDGSAVGFDVEKKDSPLHKGGTKVFRLPVIDFSVPRTFKGYDKLGYKIFLKDFKYCIFQNEKTRLTKKKSEDFFGNDQNFESV